MSAEELKTEADFENAFQKLLSSLNGQQFEEKLICSIKRTLQQKYTELTKAKFAEINKQRAPETNKPKQRCSENKENEFSAEGKEQRNENNKRKLKFDWKSQDFLEQSYQYKKKLRRFQELAPKGEEL